MHGVSQLLGSLLPTSGLSVATRSLLALYLAALALLLATAHWVWALARRRATPSHTGPAPGRTGPNDLERRLSAQTADLIALREAVQALEARSQTSLSRVAVVRYNAFDDAGSDLSFSLAVLNDHGDGLVLTGLWGRDDSRVLAKPVAGRQSQYLLSQEEQAAIDLAMRDRARGSVTEESARPRRLTRAPSASPPS